MTNTWIPVTISAVGVLFVLTLFSFASIKDDTEIENNEENYFTEYNKHVYEPKYDFIEGGSENIKLLKIVKSSNPAKKWTAIFNVNGRTKKTSFGANGMEDYTQHHDAKRRDLYMQRHAKDLTTHDVTRAGYLSYYILWGPSTNLNENVKLFKKKFNV